MKAFSLIEVIIALAVVMVAILLFGVGLSTVPLTKTTYQQNVAYHIAAKKIEELRNTEFASLPLGGPFVDSGLLELASSSAYLLLENYQGSSEIKKVTVTVSWGEVGHVRNVVLETLIGQ